MINQIKHLFPNADPLADFELHDNSNGKGPFIARWDTAKLGPQPTNAALLAVSAVAALSQIKLAKLSSITASRDAATTANVTAHTRQWQADERSQKLLSSAITLAMAGAPLPAAWRDVANSNMPITVIGELVAIAGAMAVQTQAAYTRSWALKANVDAALTAEAVNAVVW